MMPSNFVMLLMPLTFCVATDMVFEVSSKEGEECEEAKFVVLLGEEDVIGRVFVFW
jgi:hypothetical protein